MTTDITLRVLLDGTPIVTIHYVQHGRIDNATQWTLAEQIAAMWKPKGTAS